MRSPLHSAVVFFVRDLLLPVRKGILNGADGQTLNLNTGTGPT